MCVLILARALPLLWGWHRFWLPTGYAPTWVALVSLIVAFGKGLRDHISIKHGWRLAGVVLTMAAMVMWFAVIVSVLVVGSFENHWNPVVSVLSRVLPPLEAWVP